MACGGVSSMERKITRTESFTTKFFRHIQDMKQNATYSDFLIKVKGQEIPCHKLILSTHSDYFSTQFSKPEMKEVEQGFVELHTLNFAALEKCILYCYSGEIDFGIDDVKDLVEVVEHLQILQLKEHLSSFILDNQNSQTCIDWYFFADRYSLDAVRDAARQVMITEFRDVVKTPDFLDLTHVQMMDYIREAEADPDDTLLAAVQWIMHDKEERREVFEEILQIVDLKQCSQRLLKHILDTYDELITQLDTLKQITTAALSPVQTWNPLLDDMDHDFVVLGGINDNDESNNNSWLMNLSTGSVSEKAAIPVDLQNTCNAATCVTPRGMLFIGGGESRVTSSATSQCILYAKDDFWVPLPGLSTPSMGSAAVCIGDYVFLIGGYNKRKTKVECYDLKSYKWKSCPDMLQGMALPIMCAVGDLIYVVFNTSPDNNDTKKGAEITCQSFNTVASSWTFKSSLPQSVTDTWGASAITVEDMMYVVGGFSKTCVRYNPPTDQWTVLQSCLEVHMYGAVMNVKGKIVICGGADSSGKASDIFEKYNPSTDTWELLPIKLPTPLYMHCVL